MANKIRMAVFLFLLMFVFRTYASADSGILKNVTLVVNGESRKISTYYDTVGELLEDEDIELHEKDIINVDPEDRLNDAMSNEIKIDHGFYINISIDGDKVHPYYVGPKDVAGNVLWELKNDTGMDYVYEGYLNDKLYEGDTVFLRSAVVKEFITSVKVPFEREIQPSGDLMPGVELLIQEGQYGEMTTTTTVTYESGEEISRHVTAVEITEEPIREIILIGEGLPEQEEEEEKIFDGFTYERVLEMEASAYSAQQNNLSAYTATGSRAVYGVVAVDPDIIPLGTWVYIEGYGKALASDTGSAIKGNKIDLCFNTVEECFQFGRKDIQVYILD
jgi:3D (Asp-Asp-Asp) domain-containing protein